MGLNMDQYVKTLSNDSEDNIKVPFSASHFESALNSANDQLMQQYIATEECFFVNSSDVLLLGSTSSGP